MSRQILKSLRLKSHHTNELVSNAGIIMPTLLSYNTYKHTIRSAYHSLGLAKSVSNEDLFLIDYEQISNLEKLKVIEEIFNSIKSRLNKLNSSLLDEFLDKPACRKVFFNNSEVMIPLLNKQAVEWYGSSTIFNFDCIIESFVGMHTHARTIYDVGGHQGVWAAYYSQIVGDNGRVYSFEPSIINIECSALLFLINDICNVVNIPFGIGDKTGIIRKQESEALIDFVDHNIGLLRFDQVFFERADFIKIDIEGFEYEMIRSFPQLFDFCDNIHLELHIPHLQRRGLDYRDVYNLIPFKYADVVNYQNGQLCSVGPENSLEGYCSLLITKKQKINK